MLGSPRSIHATPVAPFTRFCSGGHDVERPARSRRDADRAPPLPHDDRRRPSGPRRFLTTMGAASAVALAAPARGRAQAREVKVGYILPVTGPLAFEAQLALNGLLLAVDEINGAGGIKSLGGAKITLLPGDTQNKVELGNSEAARLIDQGVTALIGPFSS